MRHEIRCTVCKSPDWLRCDPGEHEDDDPYYPAKRPTRAWCRACDPMLVTTL